MCAILSDRYSVRFGPTGCFSSLLVFFLVYVCLVCIVTLHWTEARGEDGALLHLLPVMEHYAVLERAFHLLRTTRNKLFFVVGKSGLPMFFALDSLFDLGHQIENVGNTMVEALAAVCAQRLDDFFVQRSRTSTYTAALDGRRRP